MSDNKLNNLETTNDSTQPEQKKVEIVKPEEPKKEIKVEVLNNQKEEKQPEIKLVNNSFAHNTPQDVNNNVGSFGADVADPSKEQPKEESDELIVTDKSAQFENINGKDIEINFEKFDKKRGGAKVKKQKEYKVGSSKFAVTLDTWLHNKSTCIKVWMVALVIMITVLAVGLGLGIPSILKWKHGGSTGWMNYPIYKNLLLGGSIIGFIGCGIFAIPLIYLLITILVGINGTYKNRVFHYFLWTCLIISFVCILACACCCGVSLAQINAFHDFPK